MRCFVDEKSKSCNLAGVLLMAVMLMAVCAQAAVVPSSKQMLELKPGWNLVTLTKPLDPMPGNVQKFLSLKPMRYDDACGAYVVCNDSENLRRASATGCSAVKRRRSNWRWMSMRRSTSLF